MALILAVALVGRPIDQDSVQYSGAKTQGAGAGGLPGAEPRHCPRAGTRRGSFTDDFEVSIAAFAIPVDPSPSDPHHQSAGTTVRRGASPAQNHPQCILVRPLPLRS